MSSVTSVMLNSILGHLPVSCCPVAQKSNEQANIVADTAVAGANEVAQATVEGVENAAVASGFVSTVSDVMSQDPGHRSDCQCGVLFLLIKLTINNVFMYLHVLLVFS